MKNLIITSLIILFFPIFLSAQGKEIVQGLYSNVIESLEKKDWKSLDKHCIKLINTVKSSDYDDLVSIVSYMHIYSVSALMNDKKLIKKEALKKARAYKGKMLILPGHPFKDKCMFNCIYPLKEYAKKLICTSSNESNTVIYSFEYFEIDKEFSSGFLHENQGKIMKIKARLKNLEVNGNILPRFDMFFDQVEYYFEEDGEEVQQQEDLTLTEFRDSFYTQCKYGIHINTMGSQMVKQSEFRDKDKDVAKLIISGNFKSIKSAIVFEVIDKNTKVDVENEISNLDDIINELNKNGGSEELNIIKKAEKIEYSNFVGLGIGLKSKIDRSEYYTVNGHWIKEGRICKLGYFVSDTMGGKLEYELEQNNLKLFLDKIVIFDEPIADVKSISNSHLSLLKNMQIGLDKTKCKNNEISKNCIQIFVDNTGDFNLINVSSDTFEKADKHIDKGFIIPNNPGTKVTLFFNNGTETVTHPFTIPKLPE